MSLRPALRSCGSGCYVLVWPPRHQPLPPGAAASQGRAQKYYPSCPERQLKTLTLLADTLLLSGLLWPCPCVSTRPHFSWLSWFFGSSFSADKMQAWGHGEKDLWGYVKGQQHPFIIAETVFPVIWDVTLAMNCIHMWFWVSAWTQVVQLKSGLLICQDHGFNYWGFLVCFNTDSGLILPHCSAFRIFLASYIWVICNIIMVKA